MNMLLGLHSAFLSFADPTRLARLGLLCVNSPSYPLRFQIEKYCAEDHTGEYTGQKTQLVFGNLSQM